MKNSLFKIKYYPNQIKIRTLSASLLIGLLSFLLFPSIAFAIPTFARQYNLSCNTCHAAFPRLNSFGRDFIAKNYRLENWKENTLEAGDNMLALPKTVPLSIRAQAFAKTHQSKAMNVSTGEVTNTSKGDFQSPYFLKLLSSAPLSDHISYYFYGILAEHGDNGPALIEDAWISHDDVFGSGTGLLLGQFQVSDFMFPRETRLTVQDFLPYRMAGVTYERGATLSRDFGPIDVVLGAANANGIKTGDSANSAGHQRPETQFDNNSRKSMFSRVGADLGSVRTGVFWLTGKQLGGTGTNTAISTRQTDKRVVGLDISGDDGKFFWYGQLLWNRWSNFLDDSPTVNRNWTGGFLGADYVYSDHWTYSLLYNRASAKDFRGTNTVYEGIELNTLSATASYFFMRNAKGVIEVNIDFQPKDNDANFVGHETKENYLLAGFDVAF